MPDPVSFPLSSLSLPTPDHVHDDGSAASSSDLVHLSKDTSRQPSPFDDLAHPDRFTKEGGEDESDFDAWDEHDVQDEHGMPSDLRPSAHRQPSHLSASHSPLLPGDKHTGYEAPNSPEMSRRRSSRFSQRDPAEMAKAATRKRYTYAACFLAVSLVSFAVQTETAVYIQHNLGWRKAYCML